MAKTPTRNRAAQDATLINIRKLRRDVDKIRKDLDKFMKRFDFKPEQLKKR